MLRREPTPPPFPEYHSDKLIVRLQPDLAGAASSMIAAMGGYAAAVTTTAQAQSAISAVAPGLAELERGGFIRQVTPWRGIRM